MAQQSDCSTKFVGHLAPAVQELGLSYLFFWCVMGKFVTSGFIQSEDGLIDGLTEAERGAIAESIREQEALEILTVGIDVGSSTTHLLFAKILLHRESHGLSSRFTVVNRSVEWESPIRLTPFLSDGTIDASDLREFFNRCYADAGYLKSDIDSGAVILTGEAIKRRNARAIDEMFASEAGKFVCATAGHELESTLAAHGSGAVAFSETQDAVVLHVDIGGGTSKMSLIDRGHVLSVSAFAVGGRLIAQDAQTCWTRIDESAVHVAHDLGLEPTASAFADAGNRLKVAARLAQLFCDQILGDPIDSLGQVLCLTDPLIRSKNPDFLTFSGGVAEYFIDANLQSFGDIASDLADKIKGELSERTSLPTIELQRRIRATVIGASQYTVQVSGKTTFISRKAALPVRNVPVIPLVVDADSEISEDRLRTAIEDHLRRLNIDLSDSIAVSLRWAGMPTYERLAALGRVLRDTLTPSDSPVETVLVIAIDKDVALSLGRICSEDLELSRPFIVVDGLVLNEFEYVDVGEQQIPPGVVPVVIKSLLFQET